MRAHRWCLLLLGLALASTEPADAQFRRGLLAGSTEITLFPLRAPVALLPAGAVQLDVRNQTTASARVASRLEQAIERQLTDNDERLSVGSRSAAVTVTASIAEWRQSRRNTTKWVSDKRQVGTRMVTDKKGNRKVEPVYEYGRNEPHVLTEGTIVVRLEARAGRGAALVDETTRHDFRDESPRIAGGPSSSDVEDTLIDEVARKAAALISPAREPVTVPLARSDGVDRLNEMAESRRWAEWRDALEALKPHRDARNDAYRLHNIGVAHEALAYEAAALADSLKELSDARQFLSRALTARKDEKYFAEAADRVDASQAAYSRLAAMYDAPGMEPPRAPAAPARTARPSTPPPTAAPAAALPPASTAAARAMRNEDVIQLKAIGLGDANIIAAIQQAPEAEFDLSPQALKALSAASISEAVVAAMRARRR